MLRGAVHHVHQRLARVEAARTGPCPSIFSPLRRWQACSAGIAPRLPPLRTCKANEQGLRTSAGGRSPLAAGTRFGDREADPVCAAGAKAVPPAATKAEVFKRSQKPVPKVREGLHDGPRRCLNAARPRLRFSNRHSTAALIFACSPWLSAIGQGAGPVPPWQDADSPVCG